MKIVRSMIINGIIGIMIGACGAILVHNSSTSDSTSTTTITDSIPSYIDSVEPLDHGRVIEITTYRLGHNDRFATVILEDSTECYCDQSVAISLRKAMLEPSVYVFEIWTNNDGEHEIIRKKR